MTTDPAATDPSFEDKDIDSTTPVDQASVDSDPIWLPEAIEVAIAALVKLTNGVHTSMTMAEFQGFLAKTVVTAALPVITEGVGLDYIRLVEDAIEQIEDMIGYVPEYFRTKWQMDEELALLKADLAKTKGKESK